MRIQRWLGRALACSRAAGLNHPDGTRQLGRCHTCGAYTSPMHAALSQCFAVSASSQCASIHCARWRVDSAQGRRVSVCRSIRHRHLKRACAAPDSPLLNTASASNSATLCCSATLCAKTATERQTTDTSHQPRPALKSTTSEASTWRINSPRASLATMRSRRRGSSMDSIRRLSSSRYVMCSSGREDGHVACVADRRGRGTMHPAHRPHSRNRRRKGDVWLLGELHPTDFDCWDEVLMVRTVSRHCAAAGSAERHANAVLIAAIAAVRRLGSVRPKWIKKGCDSLSWNISLFFV
jgi:hypothetical protein